MTVVLVAALNSITLIVVAWIGLKQELVRRDLVKANGHLEALVRSATRGDRPDPG